VFSHLLIKIIDLIILGTVLSNGTGNIGLLNAIGFILIYGR